MTRRMGVCVVVALLCLATVRPALAGRSEGAERLADAAKAIDIMQESDETAIPDDILAKCRAVAIFPDMKKIGWGIGAVQGYGVVVAKDAEGKWGAPAFFRIRALNTGFQIGFQSMDTVIVIMDEKGLKSFMSGDFGVGVDASVAAGQSRKRREAATTADLEANLLSYTRVKKGLYAGVAVEGSKIAYLAEETESFYGQKLKASEVLVDKKVPVPDSAKALIEALVKAGKPPAAAPAASAPAAEKPADKKEGK